MPNEKLFQSRSVGDVAPCGRFRRCRLRPGPDIAPPQVMALVLIVGGNRMKHDQVASVKLAQSRVARR